MTQNSTKLLLVDGSALLHRAYHAYPPLTSKTGEIVGAVYGVASILLSALESEVPTHVMVAWDLPKPTFRHEKYVGYKAQRPKADAEMVEQIPLVKAVITAMGIKQVEQEGYEADDIIGT
ncbi:MAG: DNA polymerase I, partial [bacterium]